MSEDVPDGIVTTPTASPASPAPPATGVPRQVVRPPGPPSQVLPGRPVWESYAPRPSRWDLLPRNWRPIGVGLLVLAVVGGIAAWFTVPRAADQYLAELKAQNLSQSYRTDEAAVAGGKSFCTALTSGQPDQGYRYQLVAVRHFCPQFSASFTVVPTPQEQQDKLTTALRGQGLGGEFPSDAAAVAHATSVCMALDAGGAQQGPKVDAISVSAYCPKYTDGFTTLSPITVRGTLEVFDTSYYSTGLVASGGACAGAGGYSDIYGGQDVSITNGDGEQLTRTQLGSGVGDEYDCTFPFTFTVMEGEDDYVVQISQRGEVHFTQAQLKTPDRVSVTLGS